MTQQAADHCGELKNIHGRSGTPIGALDPRIAAHALAEGSTLVTHHTRRFEKVPGLKSKTG